MLPGWWAHWEEHSPHRQCNFRAGSTYGGEQLFWDRQKMWKVPGTAQVWVKNPSSFRYFISEAAEMFQFCVFLSSPPFFFKAEVRDFWNKMFFPAEKLKPSICREGEKGQANPFKILTIFLKNMTFKPRKPPRVTYSCEILQCFENQGFFLHSPRSLFWWKTENSALILTHGLGGRDGAEQMGTCMLDFACIAWTFLPLLEAHHEL